MLYFVAIVAPDWMNEQVSVWKNYMRDKYGCQVALRSPAHITLVPPFSMKPEREADISFHLQKFTATEKNFPVSVKNFDAFRPRVIFLDVEPTEGLMLLKQQLDQYLQTLSTFTFKPEPRPFHPHVTIANRDLKKKDFQPAWEYFNHIKYVANFPASGISLLRHNNAIWEIAGSFPLAESTGPAGYLSNG